MILFLGYFFLFAALGVLVAFHVKTKENMAEEIFNHFLLGSVYVGLAVFFLWLNAN